VGTESRDKLIRLLNYVEQVVRLDERVAFALSEYRLPDGSAFALKDDETRDLPGVSHDLRDDEGSIWLEVMRLARKEPPQPPAEIGEWVLLSADPSKLPEPRSELLITVTRAERDAAIENGEVRPDDVCEAPRSRDEAAADQVTYDLTLRLEDRAHIASAIEAWITSVWTKWAAEELPRRRTIALYQRLYKVLQLVESAAENPLEIVWGVGPVAWQKDGRSVNRPLIEIRVDIELDNEKSGCIRIRPTSADPSFDLRPYEELGCSGLPCSRI
jgi:hypothetical protein